MWIGSRKFRKLIVNFLEGYFQSAMFLLFGETRQLLCLDTKRRKCIEDFGVNQRFAACDQRQLHQREDIGGHRNSSQDQGIEDIQADQVMRGYLEGKIAPEGPKIVHFLLEWIYYNITRQAAHPRA